MGIILLLSSLSSVFGFDSADGVRLKNNAVDGPSMLSDSGVVYPPLAEIETGMITTAQAFPELATRVVYGQTVEGRNLNLLRIAGPITPSTTRPAVEISGAIHGNEFLGIEHQIGPYLLAHQAELPGFSQFLNAGGVIYIVPVVNPDGFSRRIRANRRGADLNRDFDLIPRNERHFTQPETRSLARYLDQDLQANRLKLKFSLDYHCCVGGYIEPWSYADLRPRVEDRDLFRSFSDAMRAALGFPSGNAMDIVQYNASATSLDYFYAKYGTVATSIEGRYGGEEAYLAQHLRFIDQALTLASRPNADRLETLPRALDPTRVPIEGLRVP